MNKKLFTFSLSDIACVCTIVGFLLYLGLGQFLTGLLLGALGTYLLLKQLAGYVG